MDEPLCLVIPCFNEADRLRSAEFECWLDTTEHTEFVFVNDGSTDSTEGILREMASRRPRVHILNLARNAGKAEAVRQGTLWALSQSRFALVGYLDADLATPLTEVSRLREECSSRPQVQAWYGSRVSMLGADIERTAVRHYFGRVAATLISLTVGLNVYDSQCGAKVFRTELASQIFSEGFLSRWLFDVELLARIKHVLGSGKMQESVKEFPLRRWTEEPGTKVKLVDVLRLPFELWKIRQHYAARASKVA